MKSALYSIRLPALILLLMTSAAPAQHEGFLRLAQTSPLPNVKGRTSERLLARKSGKTCT